MSIEATSYPLDAVPSFGFVYDMFLSDGYFNLPNTNAEASRAKDGRLEASEVEGKKKLPDRWNLHTDKGFSSVANIIIPLASGRSKLGKRDELVWPIPFGPFFP